MSKYLSILSVNLTHTHTNKFVLYYIETFGPYYKLAGFEIQSFSRI